MWGGAEGSRWLCGWDRPWTARAAIRNAATLPTESIASPPSPIAAVESCAACEAPLASDQRYCLECGERCMPTRRVSHGRAPSVTAAPPEAPAATAVAAAAASRPPSAQPPDAARSPGDDTGRSNAVTVIAGVGVLLLAMGVGVLIGRSGGNSPRVTAAAPQVISVASAPAAAASPSGSEAATLADDWPAGTSGYTVQLQSLPQAGTQASAVEAAKTAAGSKGAKDVGALESDDFSSLKAGSYIVYSGVFHKHAEAVKAQAGLKHSFPGASVIKVSSGGAAGASAAGASVGSKSGASDGAGASENHPASPAVVERLSKTKGKSYEEKSKNLPDVISTG
jgi:hypothetical protein